MQLLLCLADHPGQILSVDELLDRVWAGVVVTPDSVYQAVASLRRILGDDANEPTYIANMPRRGYSLVAPVAPWVEQPETAAGTTPPLPPAVTTRARPRWGAIGASLALVLGLGFLVQQARRPLETAVEPAPSAPVVRADPLSQQPFPAKSIAVLPFVDLSEKKNQQYFADGMAEEIIDRLVRVPDLRVPARTSSFYFKDKAATVAEIASALGVANVLEGSVRSSGKRVRVISTIGARR